MEQYVLYLYLKHVLNSIDNDFKCSFNDMDLNKGNVAGIYIKGGQPSEYRDLKTGNYFNNVARVQFIIQGSNSNESLFKVLSAVSKLRLSLPVSCNTIYVSDESELEKINKNFGENFNKVELYLNLVKILGEVDFKGKTSQGLPRYSINFLTYYSMKGE